jgi:hypothetical protein
MDSKIKAVVDTGYFGIAKFHANSVVPVKRSKKKPLTKLIECLIIWFLVSVF